MQQYKDYFFALIQRAEHGPAPDWKAVLESLPGKGMGINPRPGERQPLDAPHHGITVMIDAGGNARGRIWLPTDEFITDGNGNKWATHEIQVIANGAGPGTFIWAWEDKGGPAVRPFDSSQPPQPQPEPPQPEPPQDDELKKLEAKVDILWEQTEKLIARVEALERDAVTPAQVQALIVADTQNLYVDDRTQTNSFHSHQFKGPVRRKHAEVILTENGTRIFGGTLK